MSDAWEGVEEYDTRWLGTKDLSVKMEILLKRNDPSWAPRIIYAGNDQYNAITGPAAMVAMERLVLALEDKRLFGVDVKFGYKTDDVSLCAHLDRDSYPYTAEGDYSRNDREQRKRVHILFDIMLGKLNMPGWYRALEISFAQFRVQNKTFGLVAFLKWQLPTGTTITTVRNSFYNWLMFTISMRRQGVSANALILGDDLLATTDKPVDCTQWTSDVACFKMCLKAKSPRLQAHATFLSRRLMMDTTTPCMMPLFGKAMLRFNARGTNNMAVSNSRYMAGKALSYAYEFRHVPLLRDLFLQRFEMEDCENVQLSDLSWFTKTTNLNVDQIIAAIRDEKVFVTDDEFEWCMIDAYDLDIADTMDIARSVILSNDPVFIYHPAEDCLLKDV
jgi:hypothetical protein